MAARLVNCEAQTITNSPLSSEPDSLRWEQPSLDGTSYARLEGDGRTPGDTYIFGLKLPEGFFGHYCFNARAELIVLRGEVNVSLRKLRTGERRSLSPGIIYSLHAETPAIVAISTTVSWPIRSEPGAATGAIDRC